MELRIVLGRRFMVYLELNQFLKDCDTTSATLSLLSKEVTRMTI